MPGRGTWVGRVLKPFKLSTGYLRVKLCLGNGKRAKKGVHQVVTRAFIGMCPPGHQVNHKDGKKRNNVARNLEYVTPKENLEHARKHHFKQPPLTRKKIRRIRQLYSRGKAVSWLMRKFGFPRPTMKKVVGVNGIGAR